MLKFKRLIFLKTQSKQARNNMRPVKIFLFIILFSFISSSHGETIKVFPYLKGEDGIPLAIRVGKNEIGWNVNYSGPLYKGCVKGALSCSMQSYEIQMDKNGYVLNFLDSTLKWSTTGNKEISYTKKELKRIANFANDNKVLKFISNTVKNSGKSYSARVSKEYKLQGGGNTVATFLVHMSRVREKLGLSGGGKLYVYKGHSPGMKPKVDIIKPWVAKNNVNACILKLLVDVKKDIPFDFNLPHQGLFPDREQEKQAYDPLKATKYVFTNASSKKVNKVALVFSPILAPFTLLGDLLVSTPIGIIQRINNYYKKNKYKKNIRKYKKEYEKHLAILNQKFLKIQKNPFKRALLRKKMESLRFLLTLNRLSKVTSRFAGVEHKKAAKNWQEGNWQKDPYFNWFFNQLYNEKVKFDKLATKQGCEVVYSFTKNPFEKNKNYSDRRYLERTITEIYNNVKSLKNCPIEMESYAIKCN